MDAFLLSLVAIFVAEFGDKSQLLVLAFATRYAAAPVVMGIVLAAALIQGLSVAAGAALGAALPETAISVVAGIAFLGVAAWTLWGDGDEPDESSIAGEARGRREWYAVTGVVATAFLLAELGDKTMLATFALAARQDPVITWIGATAGMVAANLVAVLVGRGLGARLSRRAIRIGSATLFAVAGVAILVSAVTGGSA